MSNAVPLITDNASLADLLAELQDAPWVAMDTEFMRERTYFPQLCLIQLATDQHIACIDPLADGLDLGLLRPLLEAPQTTKVFHAAFQDMEVLLQACGTVPSPVFDTQVAATLVGHPDQMGYARLVQDMLGVALEKSHSRTDWSRRPLDSDELQYAADDVRYLAQLYPQLREDLESRGRLAWLAREFDDMADPARYVTEPNDAWKRIKAWKKLRPAQVGILKRLAAWREEQAINADRPRGWILKDDIVADIARRRPKNEQALAAIRGMPETTVRRHAGLILEQVKLGAQEPVEVTLPAVNRLSTAQQALADLLMAGLRLRAAQADISPTAICSRADIEKLINGETGLELLSGWRREAAGGFLQALARGDKQLVVENGELRVADE